MKKTLKNKIIKSISGLLIVSILMPTILLSRPKKVDAFIFHDPIHSAVSYINSLFLGVDSATNVQNTAITWKNFLIEIGKQLARMAMKRLLNKMTQSTVNWINSGFSGSPLFLQDPGSFFKDVGKFEIKGLVDSIGYDTLGQPFGKDFALSIINQYKQKADYNAQYTLSRAITDPVYLRNYRNNFNTGGWSAFLTNTQFPQNNYIGYQLQTTDRLATKLRGTTQNAAQKVATTLQQGMGFLSPQKCADNGGNNAYNNVTANQFKRPTFDYAAYEKSNPDTCVLGNDQAAYVACENAWLDALDKAKATWDTTNSCKNLVATTPGSVVGDQIKNAMSSKFRRTELGEALGNDIAASIGAVLDALLNQFLQKGLSALGGLVNSAPTVDNWSFSGVSLDNSAGGPASGLNIPNNVTVNPGASVSTTITGGTGPYSISTPPDIAIADAQILGGIITVTGTALGTTSFTVQDSSSPIQRTTIQITTTAPGALLLTPQNVVLNVLETIEVTISGGQEPYTIITSPNSSVADVLLSGTTLSVVAIGVGQTSVMVKDSSANPPFPLPIKVNGPSSVNVSPADVSGDIGTVATVTITGGTAPYTVSQNDPAIANVQSNGNTITITFVGAGQTSIVIKDSSPSFQLASVGITTNDPLGTCTTGSGVNMVITYDVAQASCSGGSWVAN